MTRSMVVLVASVKFVKFEGSGPVDQNLQT